MTSLFVVPNNLQATIDREKASTRKFERLVWLLLGGLVVVAAELTAIAMLVPYRGLTSDSILGVASILVLTISAHFVANKAGESRIKIFRLWEERRYP
jgi:hypothetical protein